MERLNKPNQQWVDHTIYGIRIALKYRTAYVLRDNTSLIFIKGIYANIIIQTNFSHIYWSKFSFMLVKRGEFCFTVEYLITPIRHRMMRQLVSAIRLIR